MLKLFVSFLLENYFCEVNQCKNSGICYIVRNTTLCKCVNGYEGKYCEIDGKFYRKINVPNVIWGIFGEFGWNLWPQDLIKPAGGSPLWFLDCTKSPVWLGLRDKQTLYILFKPFMETYSCTFHKSWGIILLPHLFKIRGLVHIF